MFPPALVGPMPPNPPAVPTDALADGGWREVERTDDAVFDARVVRVDATTVVFADGPLRERVRDATGLDYPWRFFVASRLAIRPSTPPSRALTGLIADRAHAGFADGLERRGLAEVRRIEVEDGDRPLGGDGSGEERTRVAGYGALCRPDGASVRARAWAAVRPTGGSYLFVGGAYPTAVRDAADPAAAERLAEAFDADRFERELFALMRATR